MAAIVLDGFLLFVRIRQVCRTESLHPVGHPVTAPVSRPRIKDTLCKACHFDLVRSQADIRVTLRTAETSYPTWTGCIATPFERFLVRQGEERLRMPSCQVEILVCV